jgi:putative peptide zinc metalloprotease protein
MVALLSEHWHAVRALQPCLRAGVQPLHRRLRGRHWVLLLDPLTQRFHRMTPPVWRVLQWLDGHRSLDDVWRLVCAQAGAADGPVITQHQLVQLMASLHANDLLQTQVAPDAGEVLERYRRQRRSRFKQSWLNPMSLRLPLLHPDAWFQRHIGLARAVSSLPALLLWLALVAPAAVLAWQHWTALTSNLSDRVLSASNLALLWLVYPLVKAVHECAHGLAVKAGGGTVREIGLMFIVFTPVPYVDATSSYRFPSKWARAGVAAAGIMAELVLGALALYVWLLAEPGLATAVAYNVVLIAGVSTLVVNGNPLMRYDGYYIATDLLELPNLAQRASQYLVYLVDRHVFRATDAEPPDAVHGERLILFAYGVLSPVYRLLITIGLVWFVVGEYLLVGAIMALVAVWGSLLTPLWKAWKHLTESSTLARRRGFVLRRAALLLGVAAAFLGLVPLPFQSVHQGVLWLPDEAIVRAEVPGHIAHVLQPAGRQVSAAAPLLVLENLDDQARLARAAAAVATAQVRLRKAQSDEPVRTEPLRAELQARLAELARAQAQTTAAQVAAGVAGQWVPKAPTALAGRHVQRGEVLGYLVAGPAQRVRAAVPQEDMDLIRSRLQAVQVRLGGATPQVLPATLLRVVPGGEQTLVSAALGTQGGGEIAVDPAKPDGTHPLQRVFDLELGLQATPDGGAAFGQRVHVRFDLGLAPLAWQWALRLRQVFLAHLNL